MPLLKDLIAFYVLEASSKNAKKARPDLSRFSVVVVTI
jgi:hypothetical protein